MKCITVASVSRQHTKIALDNIIYDTFYVLLKIHKLGMPTINYLTIVGQEWVFCLPSVFLPYLSQILSLAEVGRVLLYQV